MTLLTDLASTSEAARQRLLHATEDRALLQELIQTSCLLELSKLGAADIDLATFTRTAAELLSEFLLLDGCELRLSPQGLPAARASVGSIVEANALNQSIVVSGHDVGALLICAAPGLLGSPAFFTVASQQISTSLHVITEKERLRRRAAAATAMQLAASLNESGVTETLQSLVDALASLGSATGAEMHIEHAITGAPLILTAGLAEGLRTDHPSVVTTGALGVELFWVNEPGPTELDTIQEVLAALGVSLNRCEEARRLREEAEIDPLTQLGNRRRGARALAAAFARAERYDEPLAVLALDLDHFKRINDTYGHPTGDLVLQALGGALAEHVRGYDTVVRTGGEEFLVICPGLDAVNARSLAERLRAAAPTACGVPLPEGEAPTVSIGVAIFPDAADYPDGLVRKADGALYEAKRGGRNAVVFAGP